MNSRISKEKATVALMIKLYCRRCEKNEHLCHLLPLRLYLCGFTVHLSSVFSLQK